MLRGEKHKNVLFPCLYTVRFLGLSLLFCPTRVYLSRQMEFFAHVWRTVGFTCPSGKRCSQMQYGKGSPLQKKKKNLNGDWTNILSHSVRVNEKPLAPFFALLLMTKCCSVSIKPPLCLGAAFGCVSMMCCISTEKLVETAVIEINFP